jgi:DNA-binding HxlR family transcriptional regulator
VTENNLPVPAAPPGAVMALGRTSRHRLERATLALCKSFQGKKAVEIAKIFGVSRAQVYRDLALAREIAREELIDFDVDSVLGELHTRLKFEVDRFNRLAEETTNENARISYYQLAQKALSAYIKFLQDAGLLERKDERSVQVFTEEVFAIPKVRDLYLQIMIAIRAAEREG